MQNEFNANKVLTIQAEIKKLEEQIRSSVGIVPSSVYDRLDNLQMQLLEVGK